MLYKNKDYCYLLLLLARCTINARKHCKYIGYIFRLTPHGTISDPSQKILFALPLAKFGSLNPVETDNFKPKQICHHAYIRPKNVWWNICCIGVAKLIFEGLGEVQFGVGRKYAMCTSQCHRSSASSQTARCHVKKMRECDVKKILLIIMITILFFRPAPKFLPL